MNRAGRPLRFFTVVMAGWIGARTLLLWPETGSLPAALRQAIPLPLPAGATEPRIPVATIVPIRNGAHPERSALVRAEMRSIATARSFEATFGMTRVVSDERVQLALLALAGNGTTITLPAPVPLSTTIPPLPPGPAWRPDVALWVLGRPGAASGGPVQLGGGQAGIRVRAPVATRLSAVSRIVTPLAGPGREVAAGVEWRPLRLPMAVVVERRASIDGGRDGTGIGLIGGTDSPSPISGFALETYAQTGVVARDGVEPYADGALRLLRPVRGAQGGPTVRVGGGVWGGAQREAARFDIGPSVVATVPVAGTNLRLAVDWRQRIAGNAAPGSGPAVTLGTDF